MLPSAMLCRLHDVLVHSALGIGNHPLKGRGLQLLASVPKDTPLIQLPSSCVIRAPQPSEFGVGANTVGSSCIPDAFSTYHRYQLAKHIALAKLRSNATPSRNEDFMQWYVAESLPQVAVDNGALLSPSRFSSERYKRLCASWRQMGEVLADDGLDGRLELARWALSMVLSRNIGGSLYPLIDLANHDASPSCYVRVVSAEVAAASTTEEAKARTREYRKSQAARLWEDNQQKPSNYEQSVKSSEKDGNEFTWLCAASDLPEGAEVSLCYDATVPSSEEVAVIDDNRDRWLFLYGFVPW